MPITAMLELELKPESVPATRRHAPSASRHPAFDGNLGTDVLVDQDGEAHWINYQRWETVEHEEAYRKLLGSEGQITDLPSMLAAPPVKTSYSTTDVTPWYPRRDHQDLRPRHHPSWRDR